MSEHEKRQLPASNISMIVQQALQLQLHGKLGEAEHLYHSVLKKHPEQVEALHYLGVLRAQQGNPFEACQLISRAIELRPHLAEAHSNLGNVLQALNRLEDAVASYDKALDLKTDYLDACHNRGTALAKLNRHKEAIASFNRALAIKSDYAEAFNNRGAAQQALNRNEDAIASYDLALAIRPNYAEALNNRGNALLALNRHDEAIASYTQALNLKPAYAEAFNNRAAALQVLNRHEEAVASYQKAVVLQPDYRYALGAMAHSRAHICDWQDYAANAQRIKDAIREQKPVIAPFAFLAVSANPTEQLACATVFGRDKFTKVGPPLWNGERYHHDKIRLAYLSADFHEHATAYLMAELFERHDRSRFEVSAVSFGPDSPNAMRTRLMNSFDHFENVREYSDQDVATLLRQAEVDIAVDLKGYTGDARTGIFAHRPAPIQVSYLGYPGTMAVDYIDYILADRIVIPEKHHPYYTEKVAYLPDCYQVNDSRRRVAEYTPSRSQVGLPEQGFVFCSFNNNYKITPAVFDIWIRLLHQVEASVLWLLESNSAAARNLKREATKRGVAPERLVFAPRLALPEHLARHRLADLFLDTLPYNAHTTASDALWTGLPVITMIGTTFAGRVAASLLTAIGMPELITQGPEEYEALALKLASNPDQLRAVKGKLARNRLTTPLFDTGRFTRHIETAYTTMWETHQRGKPPRSFAVSVTNSGSETPLTKDNASASSPRPQIIASVMQRAFSSLQQGRLEEAEQQYRQVLQSQPDQFEALHFLAIVRGQRNDPEEAIRLLSLALKRNPRSAEAHCNLGVTLARMDRHEEALASLDEALAIFPDYFDAHYSRGVTLEKLNRHEEAIASYDRALALKPAANVYYKRGNALQALDRHQDAVTSYDRALTLKPDYADAHADRGAALARLNRHNEAVLSYGRALAIEPDRAEAHYRRGNLLRFLGRDEEAVASYDQAIKLKSDYSEAINNRGNALQALRRYSEAIASYDQGLAIRPDHKNALYNRGILLTKLNRHAEAVKSFDRVLQLDPGYNYVLGDAAHALAHVCDWKDYSAISKRVIESVSSGRLISPFAFLALSDNLADQLTCATNFGRARYPALRPQLWSGERYSHDRIRVAYLSADFHEHATAYLMAGLFERHDRSRFETTAVSFGPDLASPMRARLQCSFDHFVDVRNKSDRDVARLLRDLEIDIAVDLKGYTTDARTGIFAHRPAPIQVNYLGYPGAMAVDYFDYILADRIVIPEEHHPYYTEKIAYLPDCYQVNDSRRRIAEYTPSRSQVGLPEQGFVFCSFNNNYKITPAVFDIWMRLLHQVEGSVLWLLKGNPAVARNLRQEAVSRGIDPKRLVFARRAKMADHLSRHRLADLFLDTLPVNAHTTASDALWTGLPVITMIGTTFAGRVAASLLTAIGMPELITQGPEEYEALALKLASNPDQLRAVKDKLARNRLTTPLFDTGRFTRHIEAAYTTMWETHQRGEHPRSFAVTPENS